LDSELSQIIAITLAIMAANALTASFAYGLWRMGRSGNRIDRIVILCLFVPGLFWTMGFWAFLN